MSESFSARAIAIIGMAGRFPGAPSVDALWRHVRDGGELISFFSDEELLAAGVPASDLSHPRYVKAAPLIEGATSFDAAFFKYSAQQAELIDPQQRIFLECALEALENAGCDPARYPGAIGVFGGVGTNTYKYGLWAKHKAELRSSIAFEVLFMGGNDSDFLTTRVSYKLGLSGPSITTQTACSSSLVAVHMACQSLFSGEADIVLAGGSSILRSYFKSGYRYEPGSIASPDGHCRPFSASACGTNFGDGAGLVVLKRLDEALADGDCIHAVIRGTAINNDGSSKVGYNAPSVDGQAAVISEALAVADVPAETIGYVEAHGTGTELGDPIEIAALTQAFRAETDASEFCAVGSIKSNIGHLGAASGIAGFIKAVLMLKNGVLPPTLHFDAPNPNIPFAGSPFYVNARETPWPTPGHPRRAGVSSFGIGGTNAHVVLEAAPAVVSTPSRRTRHVLPLSAASPHALKQMSDNLASSLSEPEAPAMADVAFTLAVGRSIRNFRRAIVCRSGEDIAEAVKRGNAPQLHPSVAAGHTPSVVFMFPEASSFTPDIGRELYHEEPGFQREVDRCVDLLPGDLGLKVRDFLLAMPGDRAPVSIDARVADAAAFATSYAIAMVWSAWGVRPGAVIGDGIGELAAACVAGVFGLEEALLLIAERAEGWSGPVHAGAAPALEPELVAATALASPPSPPPVHRATATARSVSSAMPALASVRFGAPAIPLISIATGKWADSEGLWQAAHRAAQPAQLEKGIRTLLDNGHDVFVEIGPASTLTEIARSLCERSGAWILSVGTAEGGQSVGAAGLYQTAARLWEIGAALDWQRLYEGERRIKVPLPTYPFEREDYGSNIAAYHLSGAAEPDEPDAAGGGRLETSADIATFVIRLWGELTGQRGVSSHDALADLGNDSLIALRLIGRLSDALGVDIPMRVLTEARTFADLSQEIEALLGSPAQTRQSLGPNGEGPVLLQSGTSPPLVLIHPIGGGVQCYDALVRCLPNDQTIYAIHAFGMPSIQSDRDSIESIAEAYLRLIRNIRDSGAAPPLLGWSFGGTVAFEMARQLAEAGTPTPFVGLIDSQLPTRPTIPADEQIRSEFQRFAQREARLGSGEPGALEAGAPNKTAFEIFRAHYHALYAYHPTPLPMPTTVFRARDQSSIGDGWASPWADCSTEACEYIVIPGDHFTIMEQPNVEVLGRQLMQRLGLRTAG